jgi:lipopolysaccharide heptosyltransferase I
MPLCALLKKTFAFACRTYTRMFQLFLMPAVLNDWQLSKLFTMKILVVRLSSLGDVLHLFPAITDLHRHYPDAEIHWLAEPAFVEMVGWHSAIRKVIAVPLRAHKKHWWKIPSLVSRLRKQLLAEKYDIVLDAQGLLKSALIARLAGVPVYGFDSSSAREPLAVRLYKRTAKVQRGLHIIEKNRQLVAAIFAADITQPANFGLDKFYRHQLRAELPGTVKDATDRPYIVLLHGTTWNSKYWPEASWEELIRLLAQQGWRCLLPWGNEEERQRAQRLQHAESEHAQVLPKLSLTELVGVLLHARLFISVESGIGHLAAVLDIPGIMLHGPTSPNYSGILGKACRHLTSNIYCSPCFKRDCPRLKIRQEVPPCQLEIKPLQVYLQCLASISSTPEGTAA